jgi:pimeloyl-ACP methyl ester carboxylesterase
MSRSEGRYITHPNGQTSHYFDDDFTDPWKDSDTILIQHGFARHGAFWYHWVPVLSRQYRVIRRDARGHGRSSHPDDTSSYKYDAETVCTEIIDMLDQLKLDKVHFLGESTSGMVGEILAVKYPDRLHSLIICSSPTYLPPAATKMFAFGYEDWPTACRKLGARGWAERLSKIPGTVSGSDPKYLQWWIDQISMSSAEGLAGYAEFLTKLDARPFLSRIKTPMLILAPANSAATTVEEQTSIQQQVEGAKLEIIYGKGHEIYVDKPVECQNAVLSFLSSLPNSKS